MNKSEIVTRSDCAIRVKLGCAFPFQHVRVLENVRGNKWKAVWIDPNPELRDYVESAQIIVQWTQINVRWKGRKAFLRDEENAERAAEYNRGVG